MIDVEKETARVAKEQEKTRGEIERLEKKLSNKGFTDKAPEAVVAKEKEKLAAYREKAEALNKRMEDLNIYKRTGQMTYEEAIAYLEDACTFRNKTGAHENS